MMARSHGFTLIELLIAVSLFVILLLLAGPSYVDFINNSRIRNASEAMLSGVQLAQTAAVGTNTRTQLIVNPASGWTIQYVNPDTSFTTPVPPAPYTLQDGGTGTTVTPWPIGASQITFDGFGRIIANPDLSQTITCIAVTTSNIASPRKLNVVISNNGLQMGTKLCDPAVAATEPQACPVNACS
jgi:type IV fimbrial biogenesis protein FimT